MKLLKACRQHRKQTPEKLREPKNEENGKSGRSKEVEGVVLVSATNRA
jgi:hypothetical protein